MTLHRIGRSKAHAPNPGALYGLLTLIGDYIPVRDDLPVARDLEPTCSSASLTWLTSTWLTSGAAPSGQKYCRQRRLWGANPNPNARNASPDRWPRCTTAMWINYVRGDVAAVHWSLTALSQTGGPGLRNGWKYLCL